MPKFNPEFDPSWNTKWHAAKMRVDAIGGDENVNDMWAELEKRFLTLDEYHTELRHRLAFGSNDVTDELLDSLFPYDESASPGEMRARWTKARHELDWRAWAAMVRGRKRHQQPKDLEVFNESVAPGWRRCVERVRWAGQHHVFKGTRISETVAIREWSDREAHVCFLVPGTRGTTPAIDDFAGPVQLPTAYFRKLLASTHEPQQVSWYYYVSTGSMDKGSGGMFFDDDLWFFRRARLQWVPSRSAGFVWWRRTKNADYFLRPEPDNADFHFSSVPRAVGEAVLAYDDETLPIADVTSISETLP